MPFTWPTPIGIGWGPLTAAGEVNSAQSPFVADSPRVVVHAASLLGDVHRGQPVLMTLESGRFYIVGPVWAMGSRERISFAPNGYSNNSSSIPVSGVIHGETMSFRVTSMFGTGGLGAVSGTYRDFRPNASQASYLDHFGTIMRRGDYLMLLTWNPRPYQYAYMESSSANSGEYQSLLGETVETTTVSGHSHFVEVANQKAMFWEVAATLASDVGTRLVDYTTLTYGDVYGPVRNTIGIASFQEGEKLRLTMTTTENYNVPSGAVRRGFQLQLSPTLLLWRLQEGLSWIP
ncbi:MAG: hypothetical protein U1A77_07260 [Pirellulales bacterium]